MSSICAFTGYRPQKKFSFGNDERSLMCRSLKQRIFCEILKLTAEGTTTFITGMARGVDTWAAETVLQLKGIIPNREIKLWAAIPYARQAEAWAEEDQKRYYQILGQADRIEYISTAYYYDALRERNRWLVDHADCLLAVYDGQPGGTKYTIDYARKMGLRIILINPDLTKGGTEGYQ